MVAAEILATELASLASLTSAWLVDSLLPMAAVLALLAPPLILPSAWVLLLRNKGCVGVAGNLPFLGTVGVEGVFPTAGAGVINYGCGDGTVRISAEGGYGGYGLGLGYGD